MNHRFVSMYLLLGVLLSGCGGAKSATSQKVSGEVATAKAESTEAEQRVENEPVSVRPHRSPPDLPDQTGSSGPETLSPPVANPPAERSPALNPVPAATPNTPQPQPAPAPTPPPTPPVPAPTPPRPQPVPTPTHPPTPPPVSGAPALGAGDKQLGGIRLGMTRAQVDNMNTVEWVIYYDDNDVVTQVATQGGSGRYSPRGLIQGVDTMARAYELYGQPSYTYPVWGGFTVAVWTGTDFDFRVVYYDDVPVSFSANQGLMGIPPAK